MVHVHFDAKYRVENLKALLGSDEDEEVIQDRAETGASKPTSAKYSDLLKMHAYRDAIRRTAGAYVLYPGDAGDVRRYEEFAGFHEVLPGLGAFAIRPKKDGSADGLGELKKFLDEVVEHLSNRTTARERASFHTAESYSLREEPVPYGRLKIGEKDVVSDTSRALPPAEHHVVVAWHKTPAHRTWFLRHHLAVVRLGQRRGSFRVPPELASVRHVLFRSDDNFVVPGLFRLKEVGYKVFTAEELIAKGYPGPGGDVYAVFEVEEDPAYDGQEWNGAKLQTVLKAFESRRAHRKVESLGHHSAVTRVLSWRGLLKALKNPI